MQHLLTTFGAWVVYSSGHEGRGETWVNYWVYEYATCVHPKYGRDTWFSDERQRPNDQPLAENRTLARFHFTYREKAVCHIYSRATFDIASRRFSFVRVA